MVRAIRRSVIRWGKWGAREERSGLNNWERSRQHPIDADSLDAYLTEIAV
jgi:hypothetical protein